MGAKKTSKSHNDMQNDNESQKKSHKKVKDTILAKKFYKAKVPKFTRKRKIEGKIENKLFNLKYMSRISQSIDQSSNFRILDMIFSQDLFVQEQQGETTKPKINTSRPQYQLMNFKRINKIVYENGLWQYFLEERWGTKLIQQNLYNITRVFNLLDKNKNAKNEKIHELRHKIEKHFNDSLNFNMNIDQIRNAAKKSYLSQFENFDEDQPEALIGKFYEVQRIYLKQLDIQTLTQIHNSPFMIFQKNITNKDKADDLITLFHNKLFLDLLGIKNPRIGGKDEGFEFLSHLYSDDQISYYSKTLDFTMNQNKPICNLTAEEQYVKTYEDRRIDGKFSLYKEFYYEAPNRFIIEIYYVFNQSASKPKSVMN